ncbi:MAG: hypothetical protein DHS20C02_12800 [Micavibrio sp.]|nr:MAG: hypothetical protein DHS20C02_12800 [Micavibrio sp.]
MVKKLLQKSVPNKPALWISASLISIVLLALVVMQVDIAQARTMLENLSWSMLAVAFLFLLMEGIMTALRIWLFANKKPCVGSALKANAWYVLLLIILPARLGEVAAIVVFERYLGQKYGAAAMSIIAQRLYDVIILGTFFLMALLGLGDFMDKKIMSIAATILIMFSLFVLVRLDMFLTIAAAMMQKMNIGRTGITRKIMRLILQARIYSRHNLKRKDVPMALILTIGKWISNLGALAFLFKALHLNLPFLQEVTIAAAYNFLAIIPLQTIGGIGVGEAGLTLLLVSAGMATSIAAGASLMIRFVILIFPFIFWGLVMGGLRLKEGPNEG